jgi:tRNA-splicing ligase RtcB
MQVIETQGVPIKAWVDGVEFEYAARRQVMNVAALPFIHKHVAVMPDVHAGIGSTVGTVVATRGAVLPSAVGVDIGCGMAAAKLSLKAADLPDSLSDLRARIERAIPHGFVTTPGRAVKGSWDVLPSSAISRWRGLADQFEALRKKHPLNDKNPLDQLGTLGGGNHFIEVCVDEADSVWVMLHSGSRGIGNRIGQYFIELAREDMRIHHINLPDRDLAYLSEGTQHFTDYCDAVEWAQEYATENRKQMMETALGVVREVIPKSFSLEGQIVSCHHNYVAKEHHFGANVLVTRKGAVRAREGELGIIPGSMGTRSYIVRGKGNRDSFESCSHGAGRKMSRTEAKRTFTLEDHAKATAGVECRKDADVVDETPGAYKSIDGVMAAQTDLVDVVHTLKQVLCVKG